MPSQTISLTEDEYVAIVNAKPEEMSFSAFIKALALTKLDEVDRGNGLKDTEEYENNLQTIRKR